MQNASTMQSTLEVWLMRRTSHLAFLFVTVSS